MASGNDLSRAAWRTSSYSNNGGECVAVATADALVRVRDTKDQAAGVLAFGQQAWQRFTISLKH